MFNVDIVEHYTYLGVFIDNKLDWTKNTKVLNKKGHFLRRLRSFNICRTMLRMFSVVATAIIFAVVCWGSRLSVAGANRLNKLISSTPRSMLSKLRAILQYGSCRSGRIEEHLQPETNCSALVSHFPRNLEAVSKHQQEVLQNLIQKERTAVTITESKIKYFHKCLFKFTLFAYRSLRVQETRKHLKNIC